MKKTLFILIIIINSNWSFGQKPFGYDDFKYIITWYLNEQYSTVIQKFQSKGYRFSHSPNYTLNDINLIGQLEFEKDRVHPFPPYAQLGERITSKWLFSTTDYPSYKEVTIEFEFEDYFADVLFKSLRKDAEIQCGEAKNIECLHCDDCALFIDTRTYLGRDSRKQGSTISVSPAYQLYIAFKDETPKQQRDDRIKKLMGNYKFRLVKYPINSEDDFFYPDAATSIFIPLVREHNIFYVNDVRIGEKTIRYILDSGASELNIDESTEAYLKKNGLITNDNYLTSGEYILADGSIKTYKRIMLPNVKIGDISIEFVSASIVPDGQPLLLGKSFLDRFINWKIHNDKNLLELQR